MFSFIKYIYEEGRAVNDYLTWPINCVKIMERIKINYETVQSVYIIYDEKHHYMDTLSPDTDIKLYMSETPEAKYYDKLPIFDTVIYENEDFDEDNNIKKIKNIKNKKCKKRISA